MIRPGATLGVMGGGQLGRMFTLAARTMGYRVLVLDPDPASPAAAVADRHLEAAYDDAGALAILTAECAAVTTEFENVPAAALTRLAREVPVRPGPDAVANAQDRIREKRILVQSGLPTAPFAAIESMADLAGAMARLGTPVILKRATEGYDGKGQAWIEDPDTAIAAFRDLGEPRCILERRVPLALEVSVVLARAVDGTTACYPVAENAHVNGILDTTRVPATLSGEDTRRARDFAVAVAEALDYVGVLAVEFFLTTDGELLINEIAPRPHNTGHYTLDACIASQFDQQVRTLCGFRPASPDLLRPAAMANLLGDLWTHGPPHWEYALAEPHIKLHLYGKRDARPGRKMGHLTAVADDAGRALRDVIAARWAVTAAHDENAVS